MTLPLKAVDRLFERLSATYGSAWTRQWADVPISDVKSAWAHELSGYEGNLQPLAWALENLPENVPNVIQFRAIARRAPMPEAERLPAPKADPERMKAEIEKLGQIKAQIKEGAKPNTEWAHRILDRRAAGEPIAHAVYRMAKEVADRYPRAA